MSITSTTTAFGIIAANPTMNTPTSSSFSSPSSSMPAPEPAPSLTSPSLTSPSLSESVDQKEGSGNTIKRLVIELPASNRDTIKATLYRASKTEICPIMQEPIDDVHLDFLPKPYLAEYPLYNAFELQCGHSFHAMSLIYNWTRNKTLTCPVCRSGPPKNVYLIASKLPREWKYTLNRRVKREREADMIEQERANLQSAMQLQQEAITHVNTRIYRIANDLNTALPETTISVSSYHVRVGFEIKINNSVSTTSCLFIQYNDFVIFILENPPIPAFTAEDPQTISVTPIIKISATGHVIFFNTSGNFTFNGTPVSIQNDHGVFEVLGTSAPQKKIICITYVLDKYDFVHAVLDNIVQ